MLQIKRIIITCIAYITEEIELVQQALINCIPEDLRDEKFQKKILHSQFGDKLILLKFELDNRKAKQTVIHLANSLDNSSKSYLKRRLESRMDLENKSFFFRVDKFKAVTDEIEIAEGSDVIKIELKYGAYTQDQNSVENLTKTLHELGIIID